ncbi:DNA repair protein RAD50 [Drosophila novamexicana]|uniref:DNA repair protein RAD50 n=1 Tax=Drosophila novamexicana TaxID=47314 RepID=UPI0011E5B701|nr:DNA repair protein RAD50 [Drosophila novamexicana]
MSTIEKLSIQGVRSFGANAEDVQSITFSSPITLILGQNGCGKTTIIECLKYALTGECPPGSDSGKSFVHDPKIFGKKESLAQVKLQVRDRRDMCLSICRSMKVSIVRGKPTFKTIDSTLNFLGSDGKPAKANSQESLSFRGINTDVAVSDFMGVSKAIINSVLFCHQEDASWPLDEAKKLKEKFDAIFGITEYNKALDRIIKLRKTAMEELKVMEANMKFLEHLKKEMDEKTLSLEQAQKKCEEIKEECNKCDEEVKPIDARLQEIRNIEFEIGKYQAQKVEMDTKHKNCVEQIAKLKRNIKSPFQGSLVELELEMRSFSQRMSEVRFQRTDVEEQLNQLRKSNAEQQKTLAKQDKERCMAQQKQKNEQECKQQLSERLHALCRQLQITVPAAVVDEPQQLADLLDDIDVNLMSKQCEITELAAQNDQADQMRQAKIDELRTELTKSEQSISTQEQQKAASERESESLEVKIKQIETSLHQLKVLEKQIADTDEKYERTTRSFNQEACRQLIAGKKASITEKQKRFKQLDEQLTFLSSIAKLMAEIGLKEKELEKKNQEIHRVRSKHSEHFGKFFNEPISSNYRRAMQNAYDKLRREIQELNDKANGHKLDEQSHEIKRKNLIADIARMEKELQEFEERIYQKCHATPYDELLLRSKTAISKLQLEHGALKSAEAMYKKYIQKIDEEPSCPLCHHNMSGDEACDLTTELTDEIQKLPDNITRAEKALKSEQLKYENLLQIRPAIDKVKELKETLPKKKEELRGIERRLGEIVAEYETLMALLGEPTNNVELANAMLGDMTLLDEALKESVRVKKDLEQLKLKLPESYDANVSTEALQAEKTEVSKELEAESKALETSQQTFEQQMEALNRLREFRNGLKDKRIKLQEGVQSLPQLKDRLDELTRMLITLTTEIAELRSKIQPIKQRLSAALSEKARMKESERLQLSQLQAKYQEYKSTDQDIQRLRKQAQEFASLDLVNAISKYDATINSIKAELNKMEAQIQEKSEQLETLKTECLNQQSLERDLKDNRELKQLQLKEAELSENCQTLSKELGNLDFRSVTKEKNELMKKRDVASVRRGELLGQQGEINNQVAKLQMEISEPKYKESMKNYMRGQFEVAVKRRGIDDLGQHRVALEWALIQFHAEKMNNINSLIREYWRMIYKGNDIDYIQIKTDELDKDASADRRKNYNYRVVQSKNNSEIEMRGRCSAGQRVLGSLIIRMALAETFSSNCGVLALDEPTTNLDRDNIVSLCDALNRIVESRQYQSNFMLIIITHDENFISSLGRITSYHRVQRDSECKSLIQKVRVGEK